MQSSLREIVSGVKQVPTFPKGFGLRSVAVRLPSGPSRPVLTLFLPLASRRKSRYYSIAKIAPKFTLLSGYGTYTDPPSMTFAVEVGRLTACSSQGYQPRLWELRIVY